ncbi:hypothetical protein DFQ11_10347 [Winogradskyella epiphytica]|uniref:DUF1684 domain-containing protein n=1 Tax=Winogradskyella epiphytica TaxID=262005 RepID=A0A2V4YCN1_9FLAO|nr:DUF1684 domain-containing protein [Winogradskyella epiphytica]PYE80967.1 hypothetical protein DFQ11_10347 [Winogradskyella epiphytica]GGW65869.1 hypothetical protein GCM10008085_17100 [Winogradskyella epiphytica]
MRNLVLLFTVVFLASCGQKKVIDSNLTPFQKKINSEFKDASTSPLKAKDLKNFEGLDFFPYDSTFVVTANLKRTPGTEWFDMKTTTDRLSKERVFGVLSFELHGKTYNLNVYQGQETMQTEGYENYLFLPFLDNTNGSSTYAGGRYIDLSIPNGNTMTIDFNSAYNPYCAYDEKYSCPIVPSENYIDLDVEAGVKAFVK